VRAATRRCTSPVACPRVLERARPSAIPLRLEPDREQVEQRGLKQWPHTQLDIARGHASSGGKSTQRLGRRGPFGALGNGLACSRPRRRPGGHRVRGCSVLLKLTLGSQPTTPRTTAPYAHANRPVPRPERCPERERFEFEFRRRQNVPLP
jgi:hypothetical protein